MGRRIADGSLVARRAGKAGNSTHLTNGSTVLLWPTILPLNGRANHVRSAHCGSLAALCFLLRTAPISSMPTESSHTASTAMLGQFGCWVRS